MSSNPRDPFDDPGKPVPIDRDELLSLIEENGGPGRCDLSGRVFLADRFASDWHGGSPMDLSPQALEPLAESYRARTGTGPPWLAGGPINLRGADLRGSWLPGTLMQGAVLAGAKLRKCVLFGTHLEGALLSYADLREAMINQASLQGAQLPFAKLQGARLGDVDLERPIWGGPSSSD